MTGVMNETLPENSKNSFNEEEHWVKKVLKIYTAAIIMQILLIFAIAAVVEVGNQGILKIKQGIQIIIDIYQENVNGIERPKKHDSEKRESGGRNTSKKQITSTEGQHDTGRCREYASTNRLCS